YWQVLSFVSELQRCVLHEKPFGCPPPMCCVHENESFVPMVGQNERERMKNSERQQRKSEDVQGLYRHWDRARGNFPLPHMSFTFTMLDKGRQSLLILLSCCL
ncbi:unnamed protein product, partial [Discosporangium mesarthrocarpum]